MTSPDPNRDRILVEGDERIAANALDALRRHLPPGLDTGPPIAMRTHEDATGNRRVLVQTRRGIWSVGVAFVPGVVHSRRLDSPLDEQWDIGSGHVEQVEYLNGREVTRSSHHLNVAESDQIGAAARDQVNRWLAE